MKQNPCRYCALSMERNGRHYPSYQNECGKCENWKKHKKYLMSQRIYERGEAITSLAELLEQTWVFCGWGDKPMHIEAVKSWQVRIVLNVLEKGNFYKAVKKNMGV